jgi:hypothetical protein
MAQDPFSAHSFDPATLRILYAAYDAAWKSVEQHTEAANREQVREVIALAILDLANVGQRNPLVLEAYGEDRAHSAFGVSGRRAS